MNRILLLFLCFIAISALIFPDTWQETTTADFAAGAVTNTQAVSDTVQLAEQSAWWNPSNNWWSPSSATWWDSNYNYRKAITVSNRNSTALTDYQVKIENPIWNETGFFRHGQRRRFGHRRRRRADHNRPSMDERQSGQGRFRPEF